MFLSSTLLTTGLGAALVVHGGIRAPARADGVTVESNLAYYAGPGAAGERHRLDLYLPAERTDYPLVVFLHGGGFTSGDRRNHANIGQALAARGVGAALANYRLTDGGPASAIHPDHATDVARAVAFARAQLIVRGAPSRDLFVMGQGAGAHLAALVAVNPRFLAAEGMGPGDLRGIVGLSGTYALDPAARTFANIFGVDPAGRMDASPVHHASAADPPALLLYAEDDLPRRDAEATTFAQALARAGVAVRLHVMPERDFDTLPAAIGRPGDAATDLIVAFVEGHRGRAFPSPTPTPRPAPTPTATPAQVAPPSQPHDGPGGSSRPHARAAAADVGAGAAPAYHLVVPVEPDPTAPAPVVVFVGDDVAAPADGYAAWLAHVARGGAIVVAPVVPASGLPADRWAAAAAAAVRRALDDLARGAVGPAGGSPDLERVVYVGHGQGAVVASQLARGWFDARLPAPRAMLLAMTRDPAGVARASGRTGLPLDTRTLFVAVETSGPFDDPAEAALWDATAHLPGVWRNRVVLRSDHHGTPQLVADFTMPRTDGDGATLDALDWHGTWKWLDALLLCAFENLACDHAFGGGPAQTGLGIWADGRPVRPARLSDGPRRPARWTSSLPWVTRDDRPGRR